MTTEREFDPDATVEMPRPVQIDADLEEEEVDPEKTLVRDDWETAVIRRIAPHVAAVQSAVAEDSGAEARFGWETEGLRRLSREMARARGE
jgi:diaminopimelate decarboxylase